MYHNTEIMIIIMHHTTSWCGQINYDLHCGCMARNTMCKTSMVYSVKYTVSYTCCFGYASVQVYIMSSHKTAQIIDTF